MEKANYSRTAVFALGEAGGRGVEGEVFPASPSNGTWQVTFGGHKPSATAIILKWLFHSDQVLCGKCRSLVGATFN